MKLLCKRLTSSLGKKQLMALTGLALFGFLIAHLAGNCLIYGGPEAFNLYAHALVSNPLIYPAEFILGLVFLTHIGLAANLTWQNRRARPLPYAKKASAGAKTLASSSMPFTGVIILIFLIFHVWHFKFGPRYDFAGHPGVRDLHRLLIEYFQNPWAVAWYVFAMLALSLHLSHGLWSAAQSLGLHHPRWEKWIRLKARLVGLLVAAGFAALPFYCQQQGGQ